MADVDSMTISVVKGHGNLNHNNREFSTKNVDQDRTKDNITYVRQPLDEAYEKIFGDAIREYNLNQKRADRKIDGAKGYMDHIRQSKNGEKLFYENVVQVGNKQDMMNPEKREKAIKILDEYAKNFQKNNPNLHVFNMVMHLDEATPHLHIDYIPIAHEYKKGLQVRNSLDKALKEQGIDGIANKKQNSTMNWQHGEKMRIKAIMKEHDISKTPDKGIRRKHMTVDQYKTLCEVVENKVKALPKQIETAPYAFNKERVSVAKTDLKALEERAKLSLQHQDACKEIEKQIKETLSVAKTEKAKASVSIERKENDATKLRDDAAKELQQAQAMRTKYENLYHSQEMLNKQYKALENSYSLQKAEIGNLKAELERKDILIASLNKQIKDLKQNVQNKINEATQNISERVQELVEKCESMAETTRNAIRSVSWIREKTAEPEVQKVCDAVQEYGEHWLKHDGFAEMANEVFEPSLSKGIKEFMEPDYKSIVYIKGDGKRYGWYSSKAEGHVYLGAKSDLADLMEKYPNAKFSDPFEHVPELHSKSWNIGFRGE